MVRLEPALECFDRQLCGLVRAGAERLPGINTDRQAIVGKRRILPARNHVEVIADREARIRFLPFLRPVAFFNDRPGNGRTLPSRAAEQIAHIVFDAFEITPQVEIEDETGESRFGRVTLPDTVDTMVGKLTDNAFDQLVWNVAGE